MNVFLLHLFFSSSPSIDTSLMFFFIYFLFSFSTFWFLCILNQCCSLIYSKSYHIKQNFVFQFEISFTLCFLLNFQFEINFFRAYFYILWKKKLFFYIYMFLFFICWLSFSSSSIVIFYLSLHFFLSYQLLSFSSSYQSMFFLIYY